MAKVSISDLIANDIVHCGIDDTSGFQYIVYLDTYVENFDDELKEYIYNHIEDIKNSIIKNENIADFYYDDKDKSFDMVFYLDSVFDRVDKLVYNTGKIFDLNLSVESVREISQKVMEDDPINDDITNKVKCCDERMEY